MFEVTIMEKDRIQSFASVGLLSIVLVIIIIRLTPFPDLDVPEVSCDRPCHELEWPRICRFEFLLESYRLPRRICDEEEHCDQSAFDLDSKNELLIANREIPASTIHVCVHDILQINVINQIIDREVSIHWRGQTMNKEPLMDGVSMVSQCPINSYTTFQYKFRASDVGTHSWNLHSGRGGSSNYNYINGLLVVRQSIRQDPHQFLFDHDLSSHRILLKTLINNQRAVISINGKYFREWSKRELTYNITEGERFRFRVAHFGGSVFCAISISVEKHTLVVIALDGNPIKGINTTSFTITQGERLDFVLTANQTSGVYDMKFQLVNCPVSASSIMKLVYSEKKKEQMRKSVEKEEIHREELPLSRPFSTVVVGNCGKSATCLENVLSISHKPSTELEGRAEKVYYLTYGYKKVKVGDFEETFSVPQINERTFLRPASPLSSQSEDVSTEKWCRDEHEPQFCTNSIICHCTHIIDVDMSTVIDIVLIHEEKYPQREHIFHLHGHKFYVLGRQISEKKLFVGNDHELRFHEELAIKDTINVPRNGSAVIRFLADNVGYWLLEEEEEGSQGMQIVFHVIGKINDVPENFPKCGNWIGPKYFMA